MNNSAYQQRLEKNARAFKWLIIVGTLLFVISRAIYACHEMRNQPVPPPAENQLKDTLVEGHQDVDGTVPLLIKMVPKH
jgi:hypothetical protein